MIWNSTQKIATGVETAIPMRINPIFSTLENAIIFLRFLSGSMEKAAIATVKKPNRPSIGAIVAAAGVWWAIA